jgi:hypothetical protein
MDPRFFLIVEPAVELALRPSSSAPYTLSVEAASLGLGEWAAGLGAGVVAVVAAVAAGSGRVVSVAVGKTSLLSDPAGNSEGRPSAGRGETAFVPSAAAGRSEGRFP